MTNVAIFGAGRIGKIHASNLARQPGVSLKYVVDVFPAAATELASQHGAKTTDTETVIGDPSVSAVVIASSTGHACRSHSSGRRGWQSDLL